MKRIRQIKTAFAFALVLGRAFIDSRRTSRPGPDWLQHWSRKALRVLRFDVEIIGNIPTRGVLVSNHLSYVDILVFSAISRCTFVSKSDVESWPLIGPMCKVAGTIFVRRDSRSHVGPVNEAIAERLRNGELVVFFPEGTSTDGTGLLRFHSSLFEAGVAHGDPIYTAWISYKALHADASQKVCYWGDMTIGPHLFNLFALERTSALVKFGEPAMYPDRKSAAIATHAAISALAAGEQHTETTSRPSVDRGSHGPLAPGLAPR
jgi:lyso-ornithine lipid O-acyltransferase